MLVGIQIKVSPDGVAKTSIYGVVAYFCSFSILKYGLTLKNTLLLGVYAYLFIEIFA
jgi:hypothetical protein